jgi:hypothetical protein
MPKPKRLVRVSGDQWPEYPGNLFRMVYNQNAPTINKMMAAILTSGFKNMDNGKGRKRRMRKRLSDTELVELESFDDFSIAELR